MRDVYAMGGTPRTCLNICCFPKDGIPKSVLRDILRGALAAIEEAGAVLLGGHTVNDPELKFGLSVTGTVVPPPDERGGKPKELVLVLPSRSGWESSRMPRARAKADPEARRARAIAATLNAGRPPPPCGTLRAGRPMSRFRLPARPGWRGPKRRRRCCVTPRGAFLFPARGLPLLGVQSPVRGEPGRRRRGPRPRGERGAGADRSSVRSSDLGRPAPLAPRRRGRTSRFRDPIGKRS
jgi:hypothetical protein